MAYGTGFMHEMQYWAAQGHFVAFCNPRGSASRGADFLNMFGRFGTGDYDDFMKFTDIVLQRYPAIDPKRIGVTGGSYGGYATNWIIGHTDRFAAAASQRSISNMLTMDGTSHCAGYLCEEWTHTTGWANINQVWALAPLAYAKNVKPPPSFCNRKRTIFARWLKRSRCLPLSYKMEWRQKWCCLRARITACPEMGKR